MRVFECVACNGTGNHYRCRITVDDSAGTHNFALVCPVQCPWFEWTEPDWNRVDDDKSNTGTPLPDPLGCVHDRLFKLSGQMVLGMNLPTEEDQHSFHRTTPKKERRFYIDLCRRVEARCIEWGKQVADIAREIPRVDTTPGA